MIDVIAHEHDGMARWHGSADQNPTLSIYPGDQFVAAWKGKKGKRFSEAYSKDFLLPPF